MERLNSNVKGITLIALIITIIVLLILAGIAINVLLGPNGLIKNATDSVDFYKRINAEEKVTLAVNASYGENGSLEYEGKDSKLVNNLKNVSGIDESTIPNPIVKFPFTVVVDGYDVEVKGNTSVGTIPNIPNDPEDIPDIDDSEDLPTPDPEKYKDYIPIYTEEQFSKIASEEKSYSITDINGNNVGTYDMNKDGKYVLMNNIKFNSTHTSIEEFKGILEGNGYILTNLTITNSYGMFNVLSGATLNNIAIHNANISSNTNYGIIAATSENTVLNNCYVVDSKAETITTTGEDDVKLYHGVAGFIGDAKEGTKITKGKVIRTNLIDQDTIYYNAGVVGQASGRTEIEGISVLGTKGNPESFKAGIIEIANATTIVKDCHVQNIGIISSSTRTAGILACATDADITIDSCTVKNIDSSVSSFGGILSYANDNTGSKKIEITNCKVSDLSTGGSEFIDVCEKYDEINIKNFTIKNCAKKKLSDWSTGLISNLESVRVINIENIIAKNVTGPIIDNIVPALSQNYNLDSVNISDCYLKDSIISSQEAGNVRGVGGIISYIDGKEETEITIKRCGVSNTKLNQKMAYVAGILGMITREKSITISECYSSNNEIAYTTGGGNVGGIVALINPYGNEGNSLIKNIRVNDCLINGSLSAAAIVGDLVKNSQTCIENCEVTNNNIKSYSHASGIVGINTSQNNFTVKNCVIKDSNIEANFGSGYKGTAGIVGTANGTEKILIEGCTIEGGKIQDNSHASGIINSFGYYTKNVEIKNCTINNVESIIGGNSAAGIGFFDGFGKSQVVDCTVKNVKEIRGNGLAAAGIASNSVITTGCTVENTEIIGQNDIGGIVSYDYGNSYLEDIKLSNNLVKKCTIKTDSDKSIHSRGNIGGIVGTFNGKADAFTSNNVYDTDIILNFKSISASDVNKVGGIIGFCANADVNIRDCIADNVNIQIKQDATATNIDFPFDEEETRYATGGIVGFGGGNIYNCSFTNSSITSEVSSFYAIGGIAGVGTEKEIANCVVDNSNLVGDNGIGGICSVAGQKITNCEFKNSNIQGKGEYIGGIQAIAGAKAKDANWAVEMNGCKVTNSTIKAPILRDKDEQHYILQGRNSYYTSTSTVSGTDQKEDVFTNCIIEAVTRTE